MGSYALIDFECEFDFLQDCGFTAQEFNNMCDIYFGEPQMADHFPNQSIDLGTIVDFFHNNETDTLANLPTLIDSDTGVVSDDNILILADRENKEHAMAEEQLNHNSMINNNTIFPEIDCEIVGCDDNAIYLGDDDDHDDDISYNHCTIYEPMCY